jgi:hypothetical protein
VIAYRPHIPPPPRASATRVPDLTRKKQKIGHKSAEFS